MRPLCVDLQSEGEHMRNRSGRFANWSFVLMRREPPQHYNELHSIHQYFHSGLQRY